MKKKNAKRLCAAVLLLFTLLLFCSCSGPISAENTSYVYACGFSAFLTKQDAASIIEYVRAAEETELPDQEEPDFDVMLIMKSGDSLLLEGYGGVIDAKIYSAGHTLVSERAVKSEGLIRLCSDIIEYSTRPVIDPEKIVRFEIDVQDGNGKTYAGAPDWIGDLIYAYNGARAAKPDRRAGKADVTWTILMDDGSSLVFTDGAWNTVVKTYDTDKLLIRTQVFYSDELYDLLFSKSGTVSIPKPEGLGY